MLPQLIYCGYSVTQAQQHELLVAGFMARAVHETVQVVTRRVCVCVCLTHADVRSYVCTWHFLLQNGKDHSQTEVVSSSDTLTSTFYPQSCTTVTVQQLTLYLLNLMLKMYLWWYLILLSTQIRITVCNCSFLCVANINGHLQQMKYVKG